MRAEEKELEGPELEREQRVESSRRGAHEEEQLPDVIGEEVQDVAFDHRSRLFDALQLILAREHVNVSLLYLPQRETLALEALQTAVTGNDSVGEFVYAEDRRGLLEQALAVLQQNLTYGEPSQLAELQSKFASMTEAVGELRGRLGQLEDSQEERDEFHNAARKQLGDDASDTADKPKPKPADPNLVDFLAEALFAMAEVSDEVVRPSSLSHGPDKKEPPKPPSTLAGPDVKDGPKPPSTLAGPEVKESPRPPSSLAGPGPEARDAPKPPSTLVGPEVAQKPKPPSTLTADVPTTATATHDPAPQLRKVKPLTIDDPKGKR